MSIYQTSTPIVILQGRELIVAYDLARRGAQVKNSWGGMAVNPIEQEVLTTLQNATNDTYQLAQRQQRQQSFANVFDSWLTAKELAAQRGCTVRTIQRHAERLGGRKVNGVWRFPPQLKDST